MSDSDIQYFISHTGSLVQNLRIHFAHGVGQLPHLKAPKALRVGLVRGLGVKPFRVGGESATRRWRDASRLVRTSGFCETWGRHSPRLQGKL